MKLISNKNYNSTLSYFVGVDFPNKWEIDNPAIYYEVKDENNEFVVVPLFKLMSQSKYLLFKVADGINYKLYTSDWNQYFDQGIRIYFYDYLNYKKEDVLKNQNYIYTNDNTSNQVSFEFQFPTYILMKISPTNEYSLNRNYYIYFSNPTLQFDYSDHWVRDLKRVDGKSWNYNGKVNNLKSLSLINR